MPIYEYRRPDGTTFEMRQAFSEDALTEDPETGVPVERVLHAPAVHFKGKGFYNTDYGKRSRQRDVAANAEKGSEADSSSKSGESSSKGDKPASDNGSKPASSPAKDSKPVAAKD